MPPHAGTTSFPYPPWTKSECTVRAPPFITCVRTKVQAAVQLGLEVHVSCCWRWWCLCIPNAKQGTPSRRPSSRTGRASLAGDW